MSESVLSLDVIGKKFGVTVDWLKQCIRSGLLMELRPGIVKEDDVKKLMEQIEYVKRKDFHAKQIAANEAKGLKPGLEQTLAREELLRTAGMCMSRDAGDSTMTPERKKYLLSLAGYKS